MAESITDAEHQGRMKAAGEAAGRHLVDQLASASDAQRHRTERAAFDVELARIRVGREQWRAQIEQCQGIALLCLTVAATLLLLVVSWKLGTT